MHNIRHLSSLPVSDRDELHFRLGAPPTTQPYRVRTMGYIHDNPNHASLGTYFEDAMLLVFMSGRGMYEQADRAVPVGRGMVAVILPDAPRGVLRADRRQPYEHMLCRFAGSAAMQIARRIVQERGDAFFEFDRWYETAEILRRGIGLWPGREGLVPTHDERFRRVDAVLAEALASVDCPPASAQKALDARAMWEYMHTLIAEPIDLDKAAAWFCVSKQHLCRLAMRELGKPFALSWTLLKIDWAKILLEEGRMSVSEIANRLGCHDALYFSRMFRKHVGMSPTAWRESRERSGTLKRSDRL